MASEPSIPAPVPAEQPNSQVTFAHEPNEELPFEETFFFRSALPAKQLQSLFFKPEYGFGSLASEREIDLLLSAWKQVRSVESGIVQKYGDHELRQNLNGTNDIPVYRAKSVIDHYLQGYAASNADRLEDAVSKLLPPEEFASWPRERDGKLWPGIASSLANEVMEKIYTPQIKEIFSDFPAVAPSVGWARS